MSSEFQQGFSELLGVTFTDIGQGYSRGELTVSPALHNPTGVLHGAVLYTMADTGMGAALQSELTEAELCATIEIKISYFEAVRTGTVACETSVLRKGKSVAFLESELTNDGETVGAATGSFSVFTP
jgi:acyl-CoA thioesterase